uniref:Ig-like domain-containing protein n=1 Tax=Mustela putorius furo TaxID=9669 RepID=M3Y7C9_MUSPF
MVCLCFLGGSWMTALTLILMVLSPLLAWARDTPQKFEENQKELIHPEQGTERMKIYIRCCYGLYCFLFFKSDDSQGQQGPESALPKPSVQGPGKQVVQVRRIPVRVPCQGHCGLFVSLCRVRGVEPTVTVYPAKTQPLQHHNLLVCSVNGFYPGHIEVRWFRNGQEEESGVVSTGLIRNGDWTFQTLVMLEAVPQSGEVYTCQVEHPSLTSPVTMEWRAQSGSAQSKILSGSGGFVLGLLFLMVGLFVYFRNQKGHSGLQPTGLLS